MAPGLFANLNSAIGEARLAVRVRSMLGVKEDPNLKVGINGFGRLGRLVCKAVQEMEGIDVVAINDPYIEADYMAYMLQHGDGRTPVGAYGGGVVVEDGQLLLDGRPVTVMAVREPSEINWVSTGARYIVECSGCFETLRRASGHLTGGAQRVIIASPSADTIPADTPQFVMGANHLSYANETVISAGSTASHCLSILAKVVHESVGIAHASVSVLHSSKERELDHVTAGPAGPESSDWRSGRGEGVDVIPAASEAAASLPKLVPDLAGRVGGSCFRVPSEGGVSVLDLTLILETPCELARLKQIIREAAATSALRGKLGYRDDSVDSHDFAADGRSCILDGASCMAPGGSSEEGSSLVKLVAWYANEWPYARRMVELMLHMQDVDHGVVAEALE